MIRVKGKATMYILPGYVTFHKETDKIYIRSLIYHNVVALTDAGMKEEFEKIVGAGSQKLDTKLAIFLHEQGLLLNKSEIHKDLERVIGLLNDVLVLTIMPTEGCNFRCSYCYENHKAVTMSRSTLDQIEKFIVEWAPRYKKLVIAWFGGEPTLCKDTVLEISELVKNLQKENKFTFASNMTTNGYLLDTSLFKSFYRAGVTNYQITIDGWNHNKTRPHISGKDSLQTIIHNMLNISALPEDQYDFKIILRHNILLGDEDYSWYDYLYRLFGKDKRFEVLVRAVGNWGGESVKNLPLLKDGLMEDALKKHITYLDEIGMKCSNHRDGLLSQVCYASYPHSMVFRADGRIEKCTVALNHSENQIGMIDAEKGVLFENSASERWSSLKLRQECYTCPRILQCANMRCKKTEIIDNKTFRCYDKEQWI